MTVYNIDPVTVALDEISKIYVDQNWADIENQGLVVRKPVFGVSDPVRLKPTCSATETR